MKDISPDNWLPMEQGAGAPERGTETEEILNRPESPAHALNRFGIQVIKGVRVFRKAICK